MPSILQPEALLGNSAQPVPASTPAAGLWEGVITWQLGQACCIQGSFQGCLTVTRTLLASNNWNAAGVKHPLRLHAKAWHAILAYQATCTCRHQGASAAACIVSICCQAQQGLSCALELLVTPLQPCITAQWLSHHASHALQHSAC